MLIHGMVRAISFNGEFKSIEDEEFLEHLNTRKLGFFSFTYKVKCSFMKGGNVAAT